MNIGGNGIKEGGGQEKLGIKACGEVDGTGGGPDGNGGAFCNIVETSFSSELEKFLFLLRFLRFLTLKQMGLELVVDEFVILGSVAGGKGMCNGGRGGGGEPGGNGG